MTQPRNLQKFWDGNHLSIPLNELPDILGKIFPIVTNFTIIMSVILEKLYY
jgi:hypothetical protein